MSAVEFKSNENPLVSVIIPLYNAEKYIAETIQNVLNQTYQPIEVIIVDDGSTDTSLSVAKSFESENVKVFSQTNKGASPARNYGLREAKGEFIQFLDADDLLSDKKIEEQVLILKNNKEKVSVCPIFHFFEGDNLSDAVVDKDWYHGSFDNPVKFLIQLYGGCEAEGSMITIHSWLTSRYLIDKAGLWDERLTVDDDGEFFCRVLLASSGIECANKAICFYRKFVENKSLSAQSGYKAMLSAFLSLEQKRKHLAAYENVPSYKRAFSRAYKRMAVQAYPQFKDIAEACIRNIKELGGTNHDVTLGGTGIEFVKKIAGWKIARQLQYSFRK